MLLINTALEIILRRLVYQNRAMSAIRQLLKGKILRIELTELDVPIILIFGELKVDVLNAGDGTMDCIIRMSFTQLPMFLNRQCLMQFIEQGDLKVEGDLQLVQQLMISLSMTEFDVAELLSPWLGDIVAEGITRTIVCRTDATLRQLRIGQEWLTMAITDEWRLVPSALEQDWFCREVDEVNRVKECLVARLEKMEVT